MAFGKLNFVQHKAAIRARRDVVALGIATAAIILFVGIGGSVMSQTLRHWSGLGSAPDSIALNSLFLNIALIIFGMRRYRELLEEIELGRRAEQAAKQMAETDALTGCLNRRSIAPATDKLLEEARQSGNAVAFLMIDLDNFKKVNDAHGHQIGDRLLRKVAQAIDFCLPEGGQLARLGGDEFACILSYPPALRDKVDTLAGTLTQRIAQITEVGDVAVNITLSVGIASAFASGAADQDELDGHILMHRADIAMYYAKKRGKDRYFWFEPQMEQELRFRSDLEEGIRRALREKEFYPAYEQQIDLATGEIKGFEMLARWTSPELGEVSPAVFVPVAEELGLIGKISHQLVTQALADAAQWAPHLTLSVNVSPVQMRDPWFAQKILKLLVASNFAPSRLEIEITESCLHESIGVVRSMITSLRNQNVRIALDDFGTGYSSLAQLRSLPFDRLKVDRSFVSGVSTSQSNRKILSAIIDLAEGLSMDVTVEGIDSQGVLDILREEGPLVGQGYFFGKPEASEATRERLRKAGLLLENGADEAQTKAANAETADPTTSGAAAAG